MKRVLPLVLAITTAIVLFAVPSAGAAVTSISANVAQDPMNPSNAYVAWGLEQDDVPFGGNNAMVFATSPAWAGCSGAWPFGSPWYANEVSIQHFALHNASESGVDQVTLPAGRSMCVGVVAQDQYGTITYDASYVKFDQPYGDVTGNTSNTESSIGLELKITPNGLPTSYYLAYFKKTQAGDCMTLALDQDQFSSTDSELISDDLYDEHTVYPEITDLDSEADYCVAARISNSAGNANGNFWGYTTDSPRPTMGTESYWGMDGGIMFDAYVTPNATLSDTQLSFQYFKKDGDTCTLVMGEESYYSFPALSPARGTEPAHAVGAIPGLDPHSWYCVRAFAVNGGGGTTPGDFTTVRSVNQQPITESYKYFQPPQNEDYDIGFAIGFVDNGASADMGDMNTVSAFHYRVEKDECNGEGTESVTPEEQWTGYQFADDADYDYDLDAGSRGTENCLHIHVDSAWGDAFDYDKYISFKAGGKPVFSDLTTSSTGDSVTLNASLDPNEFATSVTFFFKPLGDAASCDANDIDTEALTPITTDLSSAHPISHTLTGLTDHTSYCVAFLSGNDLGQEGTEFFEVQTLDVTGPSKPGGLRTSNISSSGGTLSWDASTDNDEVDGYNVFRDGEKIASALSATSIDYSLACGQTTHFKVSALDASSNESEKSDDFTVNAPACPLPDPPKTCLSPVKTKNVNLKNKKKKVKATVKGKLSSDAQSMTITATAKTAKISFKVDGKSVKATKGSIKISNNPSLVTVSFKLAGKTTTVKVKLGKYSC